MGWPLRRATGIRSDPVAAANWFRLAAEQGNLDAKVNLGELHQHGVGVELDLTKAKTFLEEAALKGSAVGAQKLAELLATGGAAVPADPAEAAYWAARAMALGNSGAAKLAGQLRGRLSRPSNPTWNGAFRSRRRRHPRIRPPDRCDRNFFRMIA